MNVVCRICLNNDFQSKHDLKSFCKSLGKTFSEIYQYVSGFEPLNKPENLCETCADTLSTAYRFKKRIENNEKYFINVKGEIHKLEPDYPTTEIIIFDNAILSDDLFKKEDEEENCELNEGEIDTFSESEKEENIESEVVNTERCKDKNQQKIQKDINCPLCPYSNHDKINYRKHVYRVHKNEKLKCDGCSENFHLIYLLENHRKSKHNFEHEYKVKNDEFEDKRSLIDTQKAQATQSQICPCCDKSFENQKELKQHCNIKHPEQKYGCPDCLERFPLPYSLKKHRRLVHNFQSDNMPTICGYCGKLFPNKSLDSHIKNIHFKADTQYTCDMCRIKISTKAGLINHMRNKHMEVVYNCRYCPESFPNYSCRRTHEVRFHTFDYKYVCNFCPKKFMERVQLKKHIATHTGERSYRCEMCGMAFITLTNLKLHLASHSDERPFPCAICNSRYKTKMALKKHQRIHEERNYECPVCMQKYLVNQQLRIHITRNHPEYDLPPPGTVMNKNALKRIHAVTEKYNVQVSPSVGLSSRKNLSIF
uniref:CSON004401 protein n=1 Tax=Culicoides sonorensis TaxID=179676 RepID=A0A336LTD6_CULSO